jgi:hypothetical protein
MAGQAGLGNFKERGGIRFTRFENRTEDENLALMKWNDEALEGKGFIDWTPFEHPQLGKVEVGGWEEKFTWRNPPTKLLEEECRRSGTFIIMYASLTPKIDISRIENTKIADDLHKISATIKNCGFLPTNITAKAEKANISKPVTVELQMGEETKIIIGKQKIEIGHLEGRSKKLPGRFYTPLGPRKEPPGRFYGGMFLSGDGDDTAKSVEWLIKTQKPTKIDIVAISEKGGKIKREIEL